MATQKSILRAVSLSLSTVYDTLWNTFFTWLSGHRTHLSCFTGLFHSHLLDLLTLENPRSQSSDLFSIITKFLGALIQSDCFNRLCVENFQMYISSHNFFNSRFLLSNYLLDSLNRHLRNNMSEVKFWFSPSHSQLLLPVLFPDSSPSEQMESPFFQLFKPKYLWGLVGWFFDLDPIHHQILLLWPLKYFQNPTTSQYIYCYHFDPKHLLPRLS